MSERPSDPANTTLSVLFRPVKTGIFGNYSVSIDKDGQPRAFDLPKDTTEKVMNFQVSPGLLYTVSVRTVSKGVSSTPLSTQVSTGKFLHA